MEPIGAAASIVSLLQLAGAVIKYLSILKDASKDIKALVLELCTVRGLLSTIKDLVTEDSILHESLSGPNGLFSQIESSLQSLASKIEPTSTTTGHSFVQKLRWPLRKEEVKDMLSSIERQKTFLSLALQNDQVYLSRNMHADVSEIDQGVKDLRLAQQDAKHRRIIRWLSSPDPSTNHNTACREHSPTTGSWFIDSDYFQSWWNNPNEWLWIHGLPGCGKSVLASTIIEHTDVLCRDESDCNLLYFYFDFRQDNKQTLDGFLRSMLVQLSSKRTSFPEEIQKLHDQCEDKKQHATVSGLTEAFVSILVRLQPVYIVLDALDECSTIHSPEREAMLKLLKRIRAEELCHVNILILSRKELDIEEGLKHVHTKTLCIQNAAVDNDIRVHVRRLLADDSRLRKWSPTIKIEIETSLIVGAHGMIAPRFRWVVCQIEVLKKCLKPSVLRSALRSLPETLDETYDRILRNIPPEYEREAYLALQYLAVAPCSVSVADVAEAVAIDPEYHTFDPEDRLADPFDIVEVLSSLVTYSTTQIALTIGEAPDSRYVGAERATGLRVSHYSVKEYLTSDRLRNKGASKLHISLYEAHKCVAEACLTYLLWLDHSESVSLEFVLDFPFGLYAARYWYHHARFAYQSPELRPEDKYILNRMCVDLLNPKRSSSFINWLKLSDPYRLRDGHRFDRTLGEMPTPLFYACYLGLRQVVEILVGAGADLVGSSPGNDMSSMTPLIGAIEGGNEAVVEFLLECGVDVNVVGGWGSTALHQAASYGNETIVKLLIEHGAHLEARTGPILPESVVQLPAEDPLEQFPALNGSTVDIETRQKMALSLTKYLVRKHMFLESRYFDTKPMNNWRLFGYGSVSGPLLYSGHRMETDSATGWTPLHEASWSGYKEVIKQLQLSGADIEAKTRYGWTAMHFAAWHGHEPVVQQLLDGGASIDVKNVYGWTPLHSASVRGHENVVRLLLDRGADIEAETAYGWTAIFGALSEGHDNILALLLERGADPNAHNGYGGTALINAARTGAETAARLLLQRGADPSIKTIFGSTAIQEAYLKGHNGLARSLQSSTCEDITPNGSIVDAIPNRNSPYEPPKDSHSSLASTVSRPPVSILVVCGGNTCRSPMAEAVFRSLVRGDGRFGRIDSAGTQANEGDEPDPRTMSILQANGILDYHHVSRRVQTSDLTEFDYVLALDKVALGVLRYLFGGDQEILHIMLFGDFGAKPGEEIRDIYHRSENVFQNAYEKVVEFAKGFIAQVMEKPTLKPRDGA